MNDSRRTRLLVGFLGVLLVVLALRVAGLGNDEGPADGPVADPRPVPARAGDPEEESFAAARPLARRARPAAGADPEEPAGRVVDLRLDLLEREPRTYRPGRNPWTFPAPPPPPTPPPPPPPSPAELARQQAEAERLMQERAAEMERLRLEALKPKPPPFTMRYLGSFGPGARRLAVFSDGREIVNAREGEVLHGKFIVARIGYESVDIQFVGFPDQPPLRLAVGRQ